MRIPVDAEGYAVLNGLVHKRYTDHAEGANRTRTASGATVLGAEKVCERCYPPPKPRAKPRTRKR